LLAISTKVSIGANETLLHGIVGCIGICEQMRGDA